MNTPELAMHSDRIHAHCMHMISCMHATVYVISYDVGVSIYSDSYLAIKESIQL